MDPLQRSYSRRSLLPVEQQIIDALGLTIEEYWEFCRLADCKAKERGKEYELVPEITAGGVAESILIKIAVSLIFAAASMLLTPKPTGPEETLGATRTADVRGQTKFAELFGFDSLQDLATLGSIIPLIFAKRGTLPYDIDSTVNPEDPASSQTVVGGIRAKGMLLWSQLLSKGSHQELKMLTTLGLAELGATPSAQGLAVGDQLLRNYHDARYAAYFLDNFQKDGRITEVRDNIPSAGSLDAAEAVGDPLLGDPKKDVDVFKAFYKLSNGFTELICGTRTPNSQRSFGCHTPIPNGAAFYLDYELVQIFDRHKPLQVLIEDFLAGREVLAEGPAGIKELKLNLAYAGRQYAEALYNANGTLNAQISSTDPNAFYVDIEKGQSVIFRSAAGREPESNFPPHGVSDINTAIDQRMVDADTNINVGDLYLFGTALVQCVNKSHNRPLEPGEVEGKTYQFVCKERGEATLINGNYGSNDKDTRDRFATFFGYSSRGNPPFGHHLQKVQIATIVNNRACDQTEIGIKSVVFKKLNSFANVQSQPGVQTLLDMEEDRQPFSLGRVTTFQTRYSFFKIECRPVNSANNTEFVDISNEQVFAIKGNSPQPQYNTIRITHPKRMQYEFRIKPIPGSMVFRKFIGGDAGQSNPLQLLGQGSLQLVHSNNTSLGEFFISYTGVEEKLYAFKASNDEFKFSDTEAVEILTSGVVEDFTETANGPVPITVTHERIASRLVYDEDARYLRYGVFIKVPDPNNNDLAYVRWDGEKPEEGLGDIYRIGDFSGITVPGKLDWIREEVRFKRQGLPTSSHNYVQFDGSDVILAVWEGVDVTNQLEQPNKEDTTKLYRAPESASQAERVETGATSERVVEDNPTQNGELFEPYAYYVLIRNPDTAQEQYVAYWAGVDVSAEINQTVTLSNPVSYRRGGQEYFDTTLNLPVYRIYRMRYVAPTVAYFGKIEKGNYVGDLIDRKLYAIEKYKKLEKLPYDVDPADYNVVGGSGTGLKVNASSFAVGQWQWQVIDGGSGYINGEAVSVTFTNSDNTTVEVTLYIKETSQITRTEPGKEGLNVFDVVADYPKYQAEQTSHQDGPEHEIAFVNEQIKPNNAAKYKDLSLLGLRVLAGKDWTSMGQLSAYIQQGITVDRLINDSGVAVAAGTLRASTNNFAEIVYNLLTDARIGAGKRIPSATVDRAAMTTAAQFCRANGFTFDGVIEDRQGLRDFIATNAAFNLLDFTIIGGRFALKPSVPYIEATHLINRNKNINDDIKALFTDGNMKDMQVTFVPVQERQLFKAAVAYREEVDNGFSEQKTIRIRFANKAPYKSLDATRNDGFKLIKGSDTDPEEFLDLTTFCTNRSHALAIAKYKLRVRAHTDHTISFKTTPSSALALQAGDYIKVVSDRTHTSRFNNGSVDAFGGITSTTTLNDGSHDVFFWTPGAENQENTGMQEGSMSVSGGKTGDPSFFKSIFTTVQTSRQARVYRVDSLTIDDEGYVDIVGTHQELTTSGTLATLVDRAYTLQGETDALEQFEISED